MDISLVDRIRGMRVATADHKHFVPEQRLLDAFSEPEVKATIHSTIAANIRFDRRTEAERCIMRGGQKLFACLVLTDLVSSIFNFIENDRFLTTPQDARLPIKEEELKKILDQEARAQRFYEQQWEFVAPVFRPDSSHRLIDPSAILPFTQNRELGSGGFGTVYKVVLDPGHQRLTTDTNGRSEIIIVRKEIAKSEQSDPNDEERILSMLRCLKHPNILELYASYSHNGIYNLLFPLAEQDLKQFLQHERPPHFTCDYQIMQALFGLSSAIESVHNFESKEYKERLVGCHHDLKPQNILVSGKKLLLSDFGLSRLRPESDGSWPEYKLGEGDYIAPECEVYEDGRWRKRIIDRASDIWSFGCILSEVLTYMKQGVKGVQSFRNKRETKVGIWKLKKFHSNGKPNQGVTEWVNGLAEIVTEDPALSGMVQLVRNMMELTKEQRPMAIEVEKRLFYLTQQCLFAKCSALFCDVLNKSSNIELRIEWERARIWATAAKLSRSGLETEERSWIESAEDDFEKIAATLEGLKAELEVIASLKGDKSYAIYYQLRKLNDSLWAFTPQDLVEGMRNTLETRLLKEVPHEVEELAKSRDLYPDIGLLAMIRNMSLLPEMSDHSFAGMKENSEPRFTKAREFGDHMLVEWERLGETKIYLVEKMVYEISWTNREKTLLHRINALATMLNSEMPPSLRKLKCVSFYHNQPSHYFGLIYAFPSSTESLTLRHLIESTKKSPAHLLGDVFALARTLTTCLREVHKVNWLHKNISSNNIIFFRDKTGVSMGSPYLIGFNHSRPNEETAFTQGPPKDPSLLDYQHPQYQVNRHRFRPEFDYYSLGMVLLEIGIWKPLKDITKSSKFSTLASAQLKDALWQKYSPQLGYYMGGLYRDAVGACLNGEHALEDPGSSETQSDQCFSFFQAKVVEPLEKCCA
ncbi:kinase-like domain-containing protein [Aspergillus coremiiformis]|uniref:Kinase-like domain-containing protein n=1 Tax=Aspergillus coremiiformis TaxID=138285 RepID=A0A5N6ZCD2_9EURO|nr:kinase-like domain-containing protein [Aspergillus coremiiformis]